MEKIKYQINDIYSVWVKKEIELTVFNKFIELNNWFLDGRRVKKYKHILMDDFIDEYKEHFRKTFIRPEVSGEEFKIALEYRDEFAIRLLDDLDYEDPEFPEYYKEQEQEEEQEDEFDSKTDNLQPTE